MPTPNQAMADPGDAQLTSSEPVVVSGSPAPASPSSSTDSLTLEELNALTGRTYKTKEAAVASIRQMKDYNDSRTTDLYNKLANETEARNSKLAEELAAERRERFYLQNPQYINHRTLIERLGNDPVAVVQTEVFKDTFNRLEEHGKMAKLRTVLESNPRVASAVDNLSKARELKSKGGASQEQVESLVARAVIDAFES